MKGELGEEHGLLICTSLRIERTSYFFIPEEEAREDQMMGNQPKFSEPAGQRGIGRTISRSQDISGRSSGHGDAAAQLGIGGADCCSGPILGTPSLKALPMPARYT